MSGKVKRDREPNWSEDEREMLRQLVQEHLAVVEDRGNDTKMIRKKVLAWEAIAIGMVSSGYHRSVDKLRQQWTRMKVSAKQDKSTTKKAIKATGNKLVVPKTDPIDLLVQGMIAEQMVEDTIFIDSNSAFPLTASGTQPIVNPNIQHKSPNEHLSQLIAYSPEASVVTAVSQSEEEIRSSHAVLANNNAAAPEPASQTPSAPSTSRNLLRSLQMLPKKPTTKGDVMTDRRNQIKKEVSHSEELHALQVALAKELLLQAKEATAHAREIHALKIKKMSAIEN